MIFHMLFILQQSIDIVQIQFHSPLLYNSFEIMDPQAKKYAKTSPTLFNSKPTNKFIPLKENNDELNWKYETYQKGSPNIYEKNIEKLKLTTLSNELKVLELPAVDYLLNQIKSIQKQTSANKRDYSLYPSMRQKYATKFRDLVSDKQEIKDFLSWFEEKDKEIERKNLPSSKKFHFRQSLIASAFNEMITQICSISKSRSDILKMLWNRQSDEISFIMNSLHDYSASREKKYLQNIRSLHVDYQEQILELTKQNFRLKRKYEEEAAVSESSINTLRTMRKKVKKHESIIKQISKLNSALKGENLALLEENCRLLMQTKGLSIQQAKVLSMRALQLKNERKEVKKKKCFKKVFRQLHEDCEDVIEETDPKVIEERKEEFLEFLKMRIKEYPNEKLYVLKEEFLDEEDHNEHLAMEKYLRQLINTTEVKAILTRFYPLSTDKRHCATSTDELSQLASKQTQINLSQLGEGRFDSKTEIRQSFNVENQNFEVNLLKIKQKTMKIRNSHLILQMNRGKEFKRFSSFVNKPSKKKITNMDDLKYYSNFMKNVSEEDENLTVVNQEENMEKKGEDFELIPRGNKKIREKHRSSFMQKEKKECEQMVQILIHKSSSTEETLYSSSKNKKPRNKEFQYCSQIRHNTTKVNQSALPKEPNKRVNKILLTIFSNLYTSGRTNFITEFVEVIKNKYGNINNAKSFEKVMNTVHIIDRFKNEESLLMALSLIIGYSNQEYKNILSDDISDMYMKLYFCLCLKNPRDNKFNLWKNHTSLKKLRSQSFHQVMRNFLNENKLAYIKLKIEEFVGVESSINEEKFFIQMNPLLVYILQAYLVQKNNYYESYHKLINFIGDGQFLSIESFLFLLQLLCFDENEQKKLILEYFGNQKEGSKTCLKDCFYRICTRYELPLFQFMCILKEEQSKELDDKIKNEYFEIRDYDRWRELKVKIEEELRREGKLGNSLTKILAALNNYLRKIFLEEEENKDKDMFSFLYKIILYITFSDSTP